MTLFYEEVQITRQEITGFECDRCHEQHDDIMEIQEALSWVNVGGYGSAWGDGARVEITLCQKCTLAMFEDFAKVTW